jgi:cell division protein FtsQ
VKRRTPSRPSRTRSKRRTARTAKLRAPRAKTLVRAISGRRRILLVALLAGALALAYFGWFRNSSLVEVRDVQVEGVSSADSKQIVAELTHAAKGMTTLHVQTDDLANAVREFPSVASVSADAGFPHGLEITVVEHRPRLIARAGDRQVPVAADGTLLPGVQAEDGTVPQLPVDELPDSGRLSGDSLSKALAIGAAPAPLRPLIAGASVSEDYGTVVTMKGGIELRFGSREGRDEKWAAIAAILADEQLTSVTYVDVRVPHRPAVGGASTASAATAITAP